MNLTSGSGLGNKKYTQFFVENATQINTFAHLEIVEKY